MNHYLYKSRHWMLGIFLSMGMLGHVQAQEEKPNLVLPTISGRDVRVDGLGPWLFGMPEARMREFPYCKKDTDPTTPGTIEWVCKVNLNGIAKVPLMENKKLVDRILAVTGILARAGLDQSRPQSVTLQFSHQRLEKFVVNLAILPRNQEDWKQLAQQAINFYKEGTGGVVRAENHQMDKPPEELNVNNAWEHLTSSAMNLLYPAEWNTESFVFLTAQHITLLHACREAETP